jgi:putative SOS response-associated peptidase YedK
MCGRYTLRTPLNVLAEQHPQELVQLRWGLIPSEAKDAKIAYSTIKARADPERSRRITLPSDHVREVTAAGATSACG